MFLYIGNCYTPSWYFLCSIANIPLGKQFPMYKVRLSNNVLGNNVPVHTMTSYTHLFWQIFRLTDFHWIFGDFCCSLSPCSMFYKRTCFDSGYVITPPLPRSYAGLNDLFIHRHCTVMWGESISFLKTIRRR